MSHIIAHSFPSCWKTRLELFNFLFVEAKKIMCFTWKMHSAFLGFTSESVSVFLCKTCSRIMHTTRFHLHLAFSRGLRKKYCLCGSRISDPITRNEGFYVEGAWFNSFHLSLRCRPTTMDVTPAPCELLPLPLCTMTAFVAKSPVVFFAHSDKIRRKKKKYRRLRWLSVKAERPLPSSITWQLSHEQMMSLCDNVMPGWTPPPLGWSPPP